MREQRFNCPIISLRSTSAGSNSPGILTGYAVRWMRLSSDLGGFRERVARNAFSKSLESDADVRCLFNHDPNFPLGRTTNKTLEVSQDFTGLSVRCLLPNTSFARDLKESVSRGDINQMSFAFSVDDGGESWDDEICDPDSEDFDPDSEECGDYRKVRTIRSAKLHDVSFVTSPAYQSTSAQVSGIDAPVAFNSARQLFPEGLPIEVRNRIGAAILNPRRQETRRRITDLFL